VRADVVERVRDHQARDERVIIVSGTFTPLLAEIGRLLGISETVGTPLVLRKGRYTGASQRPVCQGPGKVARLEAYLGDDLVDWPRSHTYADSFADLPLMELAGNPVAVYPDDALAEHAREHGWEIINAH
jgi:HAD superfamily phosphoserine phosphatase-like hydrolase